MRRFGPCACALATLISGLYFSNAQSKDIDIQGEVATLHFIAGVVATPCNIALTSRDQTIAIPPVAKYELDKVGKRSAITWFNIELRHCFPEYGERRDDTLNLNVSASENPVISIVFTGVEGENNAGVFAVKGQAGGIGLRLFDSKLEKIIPGVNGHPKIMNFGENKILYGVAVERVNAPIREGDFRSVIYFQVNYD